MTPRDAQREAAQGSPQRADGAAGEQQLSQQQALWLLDRLQQQEQRPSTTQQRALNDDTVEQDW